MKITTTKNAGIDRIKMVIYGKSGAGKTTLAKTIGEPTLVLSAEAGTLVLTDSDIDMIDLTKDDKDVLLHESLRFARLGEAFHYIQRPEIKAKYRWIFIDSLTEIGQNLLAHLRTDPDLSKEKNALKLWGEYSKKMRELIKAFRDIPDYNVVFTCLAKDDKDDKQQITKAFALNGAIAQELPQYFDEVFYLATFKSEEGEKYRRFITSNTEDDLIIAKDRSGKLDELEMPDLNHVINKIRGVK